MQGRRENFGRQIRAVEELRDEEEGGRGGETLLCVMARCRSLSSIENYEKRGRGARG